VDRIAIGTSGVAEEVREGLAAAFERLHAAGVHVEVEEVRRGSFTFLGCSFGGPAEAPADLPHLSRQALAGALSELIATRWRERMLRGLIGSHYSYFAPDEQEAILAEADRNLDELVGGGPDASPLRRSIARRLEEYLEKHSTLIVDGFVTFRLKDYVEAVESAVDRAVDEYLLEREYQEFVHLLRYFVSSQEPRCDRLHAVLAPDGSFRLLDANGRRCDGEVLADGAREPRRRELAPPDVLVSALIVLAPRAVVVHHAGGEAAEETLATAAQIFGDRLTLCGGCPLCRG
jgi:putative sporulation protein YtxC